MLLQPDSQLYIIPAEGGPARALGCNLSRMNSWHSWSPDGRWLVFSSKTHSDYTQLYLTRINEEGEASPAVWLAPMVAPQRAANIPEFVNVAPDAIGKIREQFLDDYSYSRAGYQLQVEGEPDRAIEKYRKALSLNPNNVMAHQGLGFLLYYAKNQLAQALEESQTAVRLDPRNAFAQHDLGRELEECGDLSNAVIHLAEAVRLLPNGFSRQYNVVTLHFALAEARYRLGQYDQSMAGLETVLRYEPRHAEANYLMALAKAWLGETETSLPYYQVALRSEPALAKQPDYYDLLSRNFTRLGKYEQGLEYSGKAYPLAVAAGREDLASELRQRAEYCRRFLGTSSR
jgi:tetratricopeptide (TPR) repeat protein